MTTPSTPLALTSLAMAIAFAFASGARAEGEPASAAGGKTVITKQSDLPRFSYKIPGTATTFVESDAATFDTFAQQVRRDIDATLAAYDIQDKSTMSQMLGARLDLQELAGQYKEGIETARELRAREQKPAAKLLTGLFAEARMQAALDAGGESGPAYVEAFRKRYQALIAPLPWAVVHDSAKASFGSSRLASRALIVADVTTELDPAVTKSGSLNAEEADALLDSRVSLKSALPVLQARADVLHAYIAKNETPKPEIWAAREVTLTAADKTTPVNVAIWDSGIDVSLFPRQLYSDAKPTASGTHGLAYDDDGRPSKTWLYPLTEEQRKGYPAFEDEVQGRLDLQNSVDSPEARATLKMFSTMTPESMHQMFEVEKVLGFYVHGTHCAGIAVRGNPAARLVVARFDDQLPDLPFRPTEDWARRMGANFKQMADFFRERHVRVVNMSWGDQEQEFELWLSKTGGGADPEARKAEAAKLFTLWKDGIETAIKAAPDTLFVTAAGNSDSNVEFIADVPASLKLPNLIAVGAVNQSGDETSFTSHGEAVVVHADGYQVDSVVPGGRHLKLSGTSMASPNVVNLAAKLIALDASLTPAQTIDLIRRGATTTDDGRRHLIDEKRSVELLRERQHTASN